MVEATDLLDKLRREQPPPFENVDYGVRITHTVDTDMRIMSFVDTLWEFEVTGGKDQFEPLTIISVCKDKDPRRHGVCAWSVRVTEVANFQRDSPRSRLPRMESPSKLACE